MKTLLLMFVAIVAISTPALSDDELWVPAAGRGAGAAGSLWVTDLLVTNPGEDAVEVEIAFLPRSADNRDVEGETYEIGGGETLQLRDVIRETFGHESAFGAIHIEIVEEDEESDLAEDGDILASARIYEAKASGTVGQSLEGFSSDDAISAADDPVAIVMGVTNNSQFRSNWYAVNVTETDDDAAGTARVQVDLIAPDGSATNLGEYDLAPRSAILVPMSGLTFEDATLQFTMLEGDAIFGASAIDSRTNDPATLVAKRRSSGERQTQFTDEFFIEDCTFASTGNNPFFPLTPGLKVVLEGMDEGELISNTIEVLNETFVVDGVTTRVVTETEMADGELTEISRNYFAQCTETGSVFYFGEHVDIYEDGEVVSHGGEWLAGENGARAGIIMPGTVVAGSRYFQEIAPGVAMDRAEHLMTGLEIETEAGAFDDCASVRDSSALSPQEKGDIKLYCYGVGVVVDGDLEAVELELP